jgi:transcriptional regulator with XRE-family HTH domain
MARLDERIRQARRASGLTQEALAERIGVPPATVQEFEDGAEVSRRHVKRIAVATGFPPSFFRDGDAPESQDGAGLRGRIRAAIDWLSQPSGADGVGALLEDVAERERLVAERERRLAERERALEERSRRDGPDH